MVIALVLHEVQFRFRARAVFNWVTCTKTKVITLANHEGHRQASEPIKTRRNYMSRRKARENAWWWVTIGFGFILIWWKKREFFKPILYLSHEKQITFRHSIENCSKLQRSVIRNAAMSELCNNSSCNLAAYNLRKTVVSAYAGPVWD